MKVFRKTLKKKIDRTSKELTMVVNSDRPSSLDENWKRVFADILTALDFSLDSEVAFPTHMELYLGRCRELVEIDDQQVAADHPESTASDFLTHIEPRATMENLVVPEALQEEIEEIVFYCGHKDQIDRQIDPARLKSHGVFVNFHGASGTGKTLAAEIIAGRLGEDLFVVNYANLESELVGRTSKNIHAIFDLAKNTDAILMFDEADSFLSARITDLRQSADYGINTSRSQLLKELDVYKGVVIFATNNIVNYDVAFQRRFHYNIHFPLPESDARCQILQKHCLSDRLSSDVGFGGLAEEMEKFSGGDIENVVKRAVIQGMRDILGGYADSISPVHFEKAIKTVKSSKEAFASKATKPLPLQMIKASSREEPLPEREQKR